MKELLVGARKKKKLRSRELAALIGIDQSLISKFETGKRFPSIDQLKSLSEVLEIPFEDLMKAYLKERIVQELMPYPYAEEVIRMVSDSFSASYYPRREFEDPTISNTLDEINELKGALDAIRQYENYRITEALSIEYTFESNRIEGNTLTLHETAMVVNQGLTVSGKSMQEHLEAINHNDAIQYMYHLVERNTVLNERELLTLHNLVLRGIRPDEAGKYRNVQVMIQGSAHMPPPPYMVKKAMEDYFIWYEHNRNHLHPVVLAAEMHERLVTIHPFIDGNGRTSRLIMNVILLQHGFVIANMKGDNSSRSIYYSALETVQSGGTKDDFIRLVAEVEKACLERYLSILK